MKSLEEMRKLTGSRAELLFRSAHCRSAGTSVPSVTCCKILPPVGLSACWAWGLCFCLPFTLTQHPPTPTLVPICCSVACDSLCLPPLNCDLSELIGDPFPSPCEMMGVSFSSSVRPGGELAGRGHGIGVCGDSSPSTSALRPQRPSDRP